MDGKRSNPSFRLQTEIPHCRSLWIGVLQGTWKEIGTQYGQRCAKDIARNFDLGWDKLILKGKKHLWQQGRTEQEKADYGLRYLQRSMQELSALSPEMIDLFKGMGEGAARELDQCVHAQACSHFEKIALLNYSSTKAFHPDWDFDRDRPAPPRSENANRGGATGSQDADCNGFWVKGEATRTGHTYATRAAQSGHIEAGGSGRERQVSYVAIPKDPSARVFWGNGRAGNLGGIGGGLMNDRGVCCLTSGAQNMNASREELDETVAPGVKDFVLASYGVIFSSGAKEAAERVTVGTDRYRQITGRKTVLRGRGCNIVFADAHDVFCVEQNARYYSIRRPGDLGEKGSHYLVHANHFKSKKGCFDENNILQTARLTADFAPEKIESPIGSYYRFWSGMWMLRNNYGRIDEKLLMDDLVSSHYGYDEEGNRYDPDPETGVPTAGDRVAKQDQGWHGTFCAHIKPYTPENPMGTGGNVETSVFDLSTLEVWWVPVWPCHFKEWKLDWYYNDLKPYSEYRKLLWGY
jgi:hypothetical protein